MLQIFFWVCWALTVLAALLPLIYFLAIGWFAREREFLDKARGQTQMRGYFEKFWSNGMADYAAAEAAGAAFAQPSEVPETRTLAMFRARYRALIGRTLYLVPAVLFTLVVAVLTGLVIATAIRAGYNTYVHFYVPGQADQATRPAAGGSVALLTCKPFLTCAQMDDALWPVPPIQLDLTSLSAIAGAYLFLLASLIQQCRARTLVYSDLFNASLRLVVSVPLGLSLSVLASTSLGPLVAFGLGAFPIGQVRVIARRLVATQLKVEDPGANQDLTVAMVGVTQTVSDVLAEENITCAQQLADIDPVVLAVRTGLSFDYVLFLAAQSMVWCFLGPTAAYLGPVGLADCRAIYFLMQKAGGTPAEQAEFDTTMQAIDTHLDAVAVAEKKPKPIDSTLLRLAFEKIARDPYTRFLVDFTTDAKVV